MSKADSTKITKNIRTTLSKHSPEILTGIGIVGMLSTTVLSVKATPKALMLIEAEIEKQNEDLLKDAEDKGMDECSQVAELSLTDTVRTTWKCYIPATITGGLSVACLLGAHSVNMKRNAALVTAYTLSETALKEYTEKVVETIGEKKEQEIKDSIAKDRIDKNPITNCEVFITEKGNTLCYDSLSGRYFTSDIEKIRKIENDLNQRLLSEMYLGLNELYYELGLRCTEQGNELGFNVNDGLINFEFSSQLTDDGRPCLVLGYRIAPRYGYGDLH